MRAEILTTSSRRWREFTDALFAKLSGSVPGRCLGDEQPTRHCYALEVMGGIGSIDIEGSLVFFEEHGGFCDCEILINIDCGEEDDR
jgi:hypothetical protein